jgi:predicted AlkP superfamily phosphohydrolase/phosphomutase
MTEDRGKLDLTRRVEELENSLSIALDINDKYQRENKKLNEQVRDAEGETSIVKAVGINSPEMKQANVTIVELRQRINELMSINKSHQDLMGKQIVENEELKRDNKALAKQVDDYFNARLNNVRKFGV